MIRIFLFLFWFFLSLYATDSVKDPLTLNYIDPKGYESIEDIYCPEFTNNADTKKYKMRLVDFDFHKGEAICQVLERATGKEIAITKMVNSAAKDHFTRLPSADPPIDKERYMQLGMTIRDTKKKVLGQFESLESKYIDMSEFYTALFTLDGEIINIPRSINQNSIQLSDNYTYYVLNGNTDVSGINQQLKSVSELSMTSRNTALLEFFGKSGETFADISSNFFLFMLGGGALMMGGGFISRKAAKIHDGENYLEKFSIAGVIIYVFYLSPVEYRATTMGGEDSLIQESRILSWIRPIFKTTNEWATDLTINLADTILEGAAKESGVYSWKTIYYAHMEKGQLEATVQPALGRIIDVCDVLYERNEYNTWPVNEPGVQGGGADPYSLSGFLKYGVNLESVRFCPSDSAVNCLREQPSLSFCGKSYSRYLQNKKVIERNTRMLDEAEKAFKSNSLQEKLTAIAALQYQKVGEMGWFAAPYLPSTYVMMDMAELSKPFDAQVEENRYKAEGKEDAAWYDWLQDELMENTFGYLGYKMMPGFDEIQKYICSGLVSGSDVVLKVVNNLPAAGQLAGFAMKAKKLLTKLDKEDKEGCEKASWITHTVSFIFAVVFYTKMLTYIALVAVSLLGGLRVMFFLLYALFYTILIPFIAAWALMTAKDKHKEKIKEFIGKGVEIAFQPILIVLSIFMAMYAYYFFISTNSVFITQQMDMLFGLNELNYRDWDDVKLSFGSLSEAVQSRDNVYGYFAGKALDATERTFTYVFLHMYKGLLLILSEVLGIIIMASLAFNGTSIFLKMLGYSNVSDFGENALGKINKNIPTKV